MVDREADRDIPARVYSAWRPATGPQPLRRALAVAERGQLERRRAELEAALAPVASEQYEEIRSAIAAMLAGFRSMRQQGEDAEATVAITRYILREFPVWAIKEGCRRIAQNEAGLNPSYAPNDAEVHMVISRIVAPYAERLRAVTALLGAPVEADLERAAIEASRARRYPPPPP